MTIKDRSEHRNTREKRGIFYGTSLLLMAGERPMTLYVILN